MNVMTLSNELAMISSLFFYKQELWQMKAIVKTIKEHIACIFGQSSHLS